MLTHTSQENANSRRLDPSSEDPPSSSGEEPHSRNRWKGHPNPDFSSYLGGSSPCRQRLVRVASSLCRKTCQHLKTAEVHGDNGAVGNDGGRAKVVGKSPKHGLHKDKSAA